MTYSAATFYVDLENGSDTSRTALTSVAFTNSGGLVKGTKTAHGLVTGAVVDVTVNYVGAYKITVIDVNNFTLDNSTYTSDLTGTVTPRGGSSKADAWQSFAKLTSTNLQAGDTVRVMASAYPTLVGTASWTQYSKTVTLGTAVTKTLSSCEAAWIPSTNVTASADTSNYKQGSKAASMAIASAFTTGKVAYAAIPAASGSSTLTNRSSNMLGAGTLSLLQNASADDASLAISLPFTIVFNGVNYTTVYVGSNGYLTFGTGSTAWNSLGANNPPYPCIQINAADRSYQRVYAGSEDGNATYRIRYEGSSSAGGTPGSSTVFWEITFSAANPGQILIDMGSNAASGTGVSGITDGTNYLYSFTNGTVNTGYTYTYTAGANSNDFSAYQQVSFFLYQTLGTLAAGSLSLRLCSDTTGDVTVNTISIPAQVSGNASKFIPITVDTGGALGSNIQSIALYQDIDLAATTVILDNIIACKAPSAADSLTLNSLIGKVHATNWVASTAYSLNEKRIPTGAKQDGYCYQVTTAGTSGSSEPAWPGELGATVTDGTVVWTCAELESTWYAIQSLIDTTLNIDTYYAGNSQTQGYSGATETVSMYKREPITKVGVNNSSVNPVTANGTTAAPITVSGGWDRTSMATQVDKTWVTGLNGLGYGIGTLTTNNVTVKNFGAIRYDFGFNLGVKAIVANIHGNHNTDVGVYQNTAGPFIGQGIVANNNRSSNGGLMILSQTTARLKAVSANNNSVSASGIYVGTGCRLILVDGSAKNNATYGVNAASTDAIVTANNLSTGNNATAAMIGNTNGCTFTNGLFPETTVVASQGSYYNNYVRFQKYQQTTDSHLLVTDGGKISSATDQRHSASGISWKFQPTSTNRDSMYPLEMSLAKIACQAGVAVNLSIYTRRDSTSINGQLFLAGGQIAGVGSDKAINCQPAINTWVLSDTLTFTPTENGVVEVLFRVWDGTGTTNSFWIDDLAIA